MAMHLRLELGIGDRQRRDPRFRVGKPRNFGYWFLPTGSGGSEEGASEEGASEEGATLAGMIQFSALAGQRRRPHIGHRGCPGFDGGIEAARGMPRRLSS